MRKKDLEAIPLPDPPEELITTAQNDRYEAREVKDWNGRLRKEKSYITDLYFSAAEAGGILIIQMWTRRQLASGDYEPKAVVYIDWKTSRWISKAYGKWTESLLWTIYCQYSTENVYVREKKKNISTKEDTELCNCLLDTDEDGVYEAVRVWQEGIREEKNKAAAIRRKENWDRTMALVPLLPEDFRKWVEDEGTLDDNFIFYRKEKKGGYIAYCSHCEESFHTEEKLEHNPGQKTKWNYKRIHKAFCPHCRNIFDTKAQGAQQRLKTRSWVIVPQIAADSVLLRRFEIIKTFEKRGTGVFANWEKETCPIETTRVFADTETFESKDSFTHETVPQLDGKMMWRRKREVYGGKTQFLKIGHGRMYMRNAKEIIKATGMPEILYRRLKTAPEGTWIQSWLITMASRKYIEYLLKSGLSDLGRTAIESGLDVADKNATNLKDLLGVDGQQLRILKDINGCRETLQTLKELKATGEKVDMETLRYMNENRIRLYELHMEMTKMTAQRSMNYLRKQAKKESRSFHIIATEYHDYLRMAYELGRDTADEIICRTPDLKKMHDRYVEETTKKKDEKRRYAADLDFKNIAARFPENKKHFGYEFQGLTIIVPACASEIILEGQKQHHCVGASDTYMKKMNRGETFILFLRKKEDPDTAYYTLEVTWNGYVRQSYGAYDRKPDKEKIEDWLKHFTREIQKRTEREKRQEASASVMMPAG